MTFENNLANQHAAAINGMASTACNNVLSALRVMAQDPSTPLVLDRIHKLGAYTRRIQTCLETGEKALNNGDVDIVNLEWANALVLMDAVSVESGNIMDDPLVQAAVELQKSGKTA
jgi:hypothetical protein